MYNNENCPYWPHDLEEMPPNCPHIDILFDFIREFRLHEDKFRESDLTSMPQRPLELEHPFNPAAYPLCCGICKLLHTHRVYREFSTPYGVL